MSKEYERIRIEIAKKYNTENNQLKNSNKTLLSENIKIKQENEELKSIIEKLNMEITELKKLLNMSEEERKNYIETQESRKNAYEALNFISKLYNI